jgi:hypothetical protein
MKLSIADCGHPEVPPFAATVVIADCGPPEVPPFAATVVIADCGPPEVPLFAATVVVVAYQIEQFSGTSPRWKILSSL